MKILPRNKALISGIIFVALAGFAQAETYNFQQGVDGYDGVRDTYIWDDNPTLNYGGDTQMITAYSPNGGVSGYTMEREQRNLLLGFDLSSLSGQTVTSATITLTISAVGSRSDQSTSVLFAYELLKDWTEGTNTGTWASGGTWNNATSSTPWETPGAQGATDRDLTPVFTSDTFTLNGTDPSVVAGDTLTITLTNELVQSWIDNPSENYGILVSLATANGWRYPALVFDSSEGGGSGSPLLTVTAIPEPATMAWLGSLVVLVAIAFKRKRMR